MIRSFGNKTAQDIYHGEVTKSSMRLPTFLHRKARRVLDLIHRASRLDDLKIPPGNRLEALRGDLEGYYSVRINDQWRVVFRWIDGDALELKILDYH